MKEFSLPTFIVLLIIFMAIMTYLARLGHRQTKTESDYANAGGNMKFWVMAASYVATFISTSAIVGFGGAGAVYGIGVSWLSFFHTFLGIFFAFTVMGNPIRRMCLNTGSKSLAELIGARYQSKFLTSLIGFMIFILMPAYTGICLIGGARFMETSLHMNFIASIIILAVIITLYVSYGGLKGLMYTDTFMCIIMSIGMLMLLIQTYIAIGGITAGHQYLTDMAHLVPKSLAAAGHNGWTAMPTFNSPVWWNVATTLVMGVGIGVLAQPQLVLRFLTVKDKQTMNRSIGVGGFALFSFTGVAFLIGPLTNIVFYRDYGKLALEMAGGNSDSIIPVFINTVMPEWFVYIYMLILLAATISTVNSLIHVQSIAFASDMFAMFPSVKGRGSKKFVNWGLALGTLGAVVLAIVLPPMVIAKSTAFWYGMCAAGTLPAILGAILWRKATKKAALWSVCLGYGVSLFGYLFINTAIAKPIGLCRLLFGVDTIMPYPWPNIEPLFYGTIISALALIFISLSDKPMDKEHIDKCFEGIRKEKKVAGKTAQA